MNKVALHHILLIFGGAAAILTIFLIFHFYDMQVSKQPYAISFDGRSTFRDGEFTALKTSFPNGSQYVSLYGISPNSTFLTELVDETGKKIDFNKVSRILVNGASKGNTSGIALISINNTGPGSFNGYIIAKKGGTGIFSIPITIATRPLFWESIILVIIGVCISVCIWEIILHYRDSQKASENTNLEPLVVSKRANANKARKIAFRYLGDVQEIKYLSTHGIVQPRDLAKTPVAENIAEAYFKIAEAKNVKAQTLQNQIAQNEVHVRKRQNKNSAPLKSAGRIALIELAPTFFGIFIAMFAVLNEQIVVDTAVLSSLLVAKLIGIGLATGSLKQLIDK